MTLGGWIIMSVSVSLMTGLFLWSGWRIFTTQNVEPADVPDEE